MQQQWNPQTLECIKAMEDGLPSLISTTDITFALIVSSLFRKQCVRSLLLAPSNHLKHLLLLPTI
jgi:hypothetical protein